MDRKERKDDLTALGEEAFANHVLKHSGEHRWVIKREESSCYWAEIVSLASGRVLVHGDISTVVFGAYSGADVLSKLRWVGGLLKSGTAYAKEKSHCGMDRSHSTTYDVDIAADDIGDLLAQGADYGYSGETLEALQGLMRRIPDLGQREMVRELVEITDDCDLYSTGECIAPRVVYAVLAVRKLLELLPEE